jgi:hypothetical protein
VSGARAAFAIPPRCAITPARERRDQAAGDARGEQGVAAGGDPHRADQILRLGVLEQEAARAGPQRLVDVIVGLERGQDDDLHPGQGAVRGDPAGGLEAIDPGHPDVHQDHVGALGARQLHRLLAVDRLADHLDVSVRLEQHPEAGPDQRLVVGEEHPDHELAC